MDLDAIVLVGRKNLETPGTSPFSPSGSGICVHPDGVVATCCHTLVNFFNQWSPYSIPRRPDVREVIVDAEPHERPFFFFPSESLWDQPGKSHEARVYPMMSFQADREQDVAVVELGGEGADRPLPFVPIARNRPIVGDTVQFAGYLQGADTLFDSEGNVLGWRMTREVVKVVACHPEGFLIDFPVVRGMSGSGVCDQKGALLGIVCEHWPAKVAAQRVGIERPLGLVAYAELLIPQYQVLRASAIERKGNGELPWCGLA